MSKSFFLAGGIFACVLGLEMLLVDSAVVTPLNGGGPPVDMEVDRWPLPTRSMGLAPFNILPF